MRYNTKGLLQLVISLPGELITDDGRLRSQRGQRQVRLRLRSGLVRVGVQIRNSASTADAECADGRRSRENMRCNFKRGSKFDFDRAGILPVPSAILFYSILLVGYVRSYFSSSFYLYPYPGLLSALPAYFLSYEYLPCTGRPTYVLRNVGTYRYEQVLYFILRENAGMEPPV